MDLLESPLNEKETLVQELSDRYMWRKMMYNLQLVFYRSKPKSFIGRKLHLWRWDYNTIANQSKYRMVYLQPPAKTRDYEYLVSSHVWEWRKLVSHLACVFQPTWLFPSYMGRFLTRSDSLQWESHGWTSCVWIGVVKLARISSRHLHPVGPLITHGKWPFKPLWIRVGNSTHGTRKTVVFSTFPLNSFLTKEGGQSGL